MQRLLKASWKGETSQMKEELEKLFRGHEVTELEQVNDWDGLECYRMILDDNPFTSLYVLVGKEELEPIGLPSISDGDMTGEFWDIDRANGNYFLKIWDSITESGNEE